MAIVDEVDVLHLLPSVSQFGGTPRKTLELATRSRCRHAIYAWHEWDSISSTKRHLAAFTDRGVEVFVEPHGAHLLKHVLPLRRVLSRRKVKVVHAYFESGAALALLCKGLRTDLRVVLSFVGSPRRRRWFEVAARIADHVTYVSRYTKREYEAVYPRLSRQRASVVYNGVSARHLMPVELGQPSTGQMLAVSGLMEVKNIRVLVEAMGILHSAGQAGDCRLVIVGDGPLRTELEAFARTHGVDGVIDFRGYQENIASFLAQSELFLHPSLSEGFGIAVVEAMLAGLPVIVANAGALPELVENRETGIVVGDPESPEAWAGAIAEMMRSPSLRRSIGDRGRSSAQIRFSVDRFVADYDRIYGELLGWPSAR